MLIPGPQRGSDPRSIPRGGRGAGPRPGSLPACPWHPSASDSTSCHRCLRPPVPVPQPPWPPGADASPVRQRGGTRGIRGASCHVSALGLQARPAAERLRAVLIALLPSPLPVPLPPAWSLREVVCGPGALPCWGGPVLTTPSPPSCCPQGHRCSQLRAGFIPLNLDACRVSGYIGVRGIRAGRDKPAVSEHPPRGRLWPTGMEGFG